ncbi:DUF6677 family protein [Paenibacillus sp. NEAU-GSW1]|uniref:DUF6677 family protein n=1 Tax=Paenibacillus sp. NEAU-GSW1 TaxID=2682486 RepID=UPI0012E21B97|nr:DUF6677 family protein [Paenibacillus sp. NEAU-GSW1]MUT68621.1 DUF4097 family beta strand repeat protein [Paenibacillus sp. NEAU-GSW1]
MRELGVKRKKSRLLAAFLAFMLPGAGHLYAGRYARGLLIMAGLLLDAAAIIRLADANGARHLLFIVYLALALPAFYFVSVFDTLQSLENPSDKPSKLTVMSGVLLMAAGLLLGLLIRPPSVLEPWMNELADYSVGPLLMVAAISIFMMNVKEAKAMFKLGRLTSVAVIITVGGLLLSDQLQTRNDIAIIQQWWPAVFILLGAELIGFGLAGRKKEQRLRLDFSGGFLAAIVVISALLVTQYAELPFKWLDQYVELKGGADYGEEKGFRYAKEQIVVPLDSAVARLKIVNPNGDVTLRSGDTDNVLIDSEVWVDMDNKDEADTVAEKSIVDFTIDTSADTEENAATIAASTALTIEGKGEQYGASGARKPHMNIVVTIPRGSAGLEASINVVSGTIDASGLASAKSLKVSNVSGDIALADIQGNIEVTGIDGSITLRKAEGEASLKTKNGSIAVEDVTGGLTAETINGSVEINKVSGMIETETKNGKIRIVEAASSVKADTLNGGIEVSSPIVGGDWDIDSSVGEIVVQIPEEGDFSVYGSVTFGNIKTDFPFDVSKKTVRGTFGSGKYRIQINATNSIAINRYGQ